MRLFECAYGFGDCIMNMPLIKAYCEQNNEKVCIATKRQNFDAFVNFDFIEDVFPIERLHQGSAVAQSKNLDYFQITQHHRWNEFRKADPSHSLVETPLWTGKLLGLEFDNRPIFIPTQQELENIKEFEDCNVPIVGMEADFNSGQAWSNVKFYRDLCRKYLREGFKVLWLSKVPPPAKDYVDYMQRFTRRECVAALRYCDLMVSTCSGIFVGALGLERELQPKKIVLTMKRSADNMFQISNKLNKYQWHKDIVYSWNTTQCNHHVKKFAENFK